jgi:APA family basic amino acid/polyamine antiporter
LALTYLVPYPLIDVHAPLSMAFSYVNVHWMSSFIAIGAFTGISSALLMTIVSQARVWFALSSDGLLPPSFALVHEKYGTPYVASIASGIMSSAFATVFDINILSQLMAIGTLFAFGMVATCVLASRYNRHPQVMWLCVAIWVLSIASSIAFQAGDYLIFAIVLVAMTICCGIPMLWIPQAPMKPKTITAPFGPFIPILSIVTNVNTMCSLGWAAWIQSFIWFTLGIVVYFAYGMRNSQVRRFAQLV